MRGLGPSTEDELPKSIIVTNVETSVFENPQLKVTDIVRLQKNLSKRVSLSNGTANFS